MKNKIQQVTENLGIVHNMYMHFITKTEISVLSSSDGRELPTAIKFAPTRMDGPFSRT